MKDERVERDGTPTTILLDRWFEGDRSAFEELIGDHLEWIRARVKEGMGNRLQAMEETGDLVQHTLLEFLRYAPSFRLERGAQLRTLLARIVTNVLRGNARRWNAQRRDLARALPFDHASRLDLEASGSESPSRAADTREHVAWVRLGLELLAPLERDVIFGRDYEGLSHAELAERLECSEEAVRKRYQRAVGELGLRIAALQRGEVEAAAQESKAQSKR